MTLSLKRRLKTLERGNTTRDNGDKVVFYILDNGRDNVVSSSPHVIIYTPDTVQGGTL